MQIIDQYNALINAMKRRDVSLVKKIIQFSPELLILKSENGNTLLHSAVDLNYPDILNIIIEALGESAVKYAKIPNHDGYLPIDLIKARQQNFLIGWDQLNDFIYRNKLPPQLKIVLEAYTPESEINLVLQDLTMKMILKPSCAPIEENAVFTQKLIETDNTHLHTTLTFALQAANAVRKIIRNSYEVSSDEMDEKKLEDIYKKFKYKTIEDLKKLHKKNPDAFPSDDLKIIAENLKVMGVGNSREYCLLTIYQLIKLNALMPLEIFHVVKGGHKILVMDRDPRSDIADYKTWGPNAVVCDAWAGKIYPANKIASELITITQVIELPSQVNKRITSQFNPKYHGLKRTFSLDEAIANKKEIVQKRYKRTQDYKAKVLSYLNKEICTTQSNLRKWQFQTCQDKVKNETMLKKMQTSVNELGEELYQHREKGWIGFFKGNWFRKTASYNRFKELFNAKNRLKV